MSPQRRFLHMLALAALALVALPLAGCSHWLRGGRSYGSSYRQVHCADSSSWRDTSGCRRLR